MNQYIITEEQLQGYEKTRNRLYDINGEHYVTGFAVKIQSHPYQSERDTVLERLHIWFENYCEGNEDPDLWMAFLHAERTLRQKCKEVGNIW